VGEDLIVATCTRHRGIGRALMATMDAWARDHGAVNIELTVYDVTHEAAVFELALHSRRILIGT
jgi:GNAT superfamily N-acetyltransferase